MFQGIKKRIRLGKLHSTSLTLADIRLTQLAESCNEYIQKNAIRPSIRILWPTTFNLSKTWWVHDGILAVALRLRGADIVPTMCDRLQSDECVIWAGEWQDSGKQGFRERRDTYCKKCIKNDIEMWSRWSLHPLRLTSFVTGGEILEAQDEVAKWMDGDWQNVTWRGFGVGYEAWKAVVNNNLQADIQDWWREQAESMAYHHLLNIRLLILAYERIFDVIAPDRVFGNGGFYYPWGVVDHIAKQCHVPYFRYHKIGLHPLAWNYARNSRNLIDVGPAWQSWLEESWSIEQEKRVNHDLTRRGLLCVNDRETDNEILLSEFSQQLRFDPNRPIALAATGVAWDASTNLRSRLFKHVYEWLWETIRWFAHHPQWQLIIRVHPDENVAANIAPESRTLFDREMHREGIKIPPNVCVVPSDHQISTFDLAAVSRLGIVYTSTTGLEMACVGLPVVVVGPGHYSNKGFTFDPCSRNEYFALLSTILSDNTSDDSTAKRSQLAKRYWYLYAYHGSVVTGLVNLGTNGEQVPKELTYHNLLPGANQYVDYICDSVIHDLPIMGVNRWPPERREQLDE